MDILKQGMPEDRRQKRGLGHRSQGEEKSDGCKGVETKK